MGTVLTMESTETNVFEISRQIAWFIISRVVIICLVLCERKISQFNLIRIDKDVIRLQMIGRLASLKLASGGWLMLSGKRKR